MTMKTFGEDYPLVLTLLNSDSSTDILHQTPAYLVGLSQTTWNTMNLTLTRGSRHCRIRLSQAGHQPFPALGSEPWISDLRGSPGSSCTFLVQPTLSSAIPPDSQHYPLLFLPPKDRMQNPCPRMCTELCKLIKSVIFQIRSGGSPRDPRTFCNIHAMRFIPLIWCY